MLEVHTHVHRVQYEDTLTCPFVLQEQKQQEKLAFERHLEEKQKEHTQLILMNTSRKEYMLNSVRQVHNMLSHTDDSLIGLCRYI